MYDCISFPSWTLRGLVITRARGWANTDLGVCDVDFVVSNQSNCAVVRNRGGGYIEVEKELILSYRYIDYRQYIVESRNF